MAKKILIIEDDEVTLRMLSEALRAEGLLISEANDGERGLNLALQENPDLILLDVVLPKMDGMTLIGKLRQNPAGKKIPIILLTNLQLDDAMLKEITSREPSYYLIKRDWTLDEVVKKVKERLELSSR